MRLSKKIGILSVIVLALGLMFGLVGSASAAPFGFGGGMPPVVAVSYSSSVVSVQGLTRDGVFVSANFEPCGTPNWGFFGFAGNRGQELPTYGQCAMMDVNALGRFHITAQSVGEIQTGDGNFFLRGQLTTGEWYTFRADETWVRGRPTALLSLYLSQTQNGQYDLYWSSMLQLGTATFPIISS